jgi:hypothetical protein
VVPIDLTKATDQPRELKVPNSDGLVVAYLSRPVGLLAAEAEVPAGARTVSIFVVNRRTEAPDDVRDQSFAFQVQLEVSGDTEFLRRPDLRGIASDDWDERVADLQYQDAGEYSVGHNVATEAIRENGGGCKLVRTCWIPNAEVEKVEPATMGQTQSRSSGRWSISTESGYRWRPAKFPRRQRSVTRPGRNW